MVASPPYDFTFNIIYAGRTVSLLLPFVLTLLEHSDCRYRLVANGCSAKDEARIKALCRDHDHLSFLSVGDGEILPHGMVLNHLAALEESASFAFMDSDIFATGPFLDAHLEAMQTQTALCSCVPVWQDKAQLHLPTGFKEMRGIFVDTEGGYFLGVTYYAIYETRRLRAFMEHSGIGFQKYRWEEIPAAHQATLERLGLKMSWYDTGKLLNILLQQEGATMTLVETPTLTHLGAISLPKGRFQTLYAMARDQIVSHIPPALFGRWTLARHARLCELSPEEREALAEATRRRKATRLYMTYSVNPRHRAFRKREQYLRELPDEIQATVRKVGEQVIDLYNTYHVQ